MSKSLMDGLHEELKRNKELIKQYRAIGPAGHIGATLLQQMIDKTEKAIFKNDVVQMVKCYEELKETA